MRFTGFDWDEGNQGKNEASHNVAADEAEEVFFNKPLYRRAGSRGGGERRYVALGTTDAGDHLAVVFTMRGDLVRIISARPMTQRERRYFREHATG